MILFKRPPPPPQPKYNACGMLPYAIMLGWKQPAEDSDGYWEKNGRRVHENLMPTQMWRELHTYALKESEVPCLRQLKEAVQLMAKAAELIHLAQPQIGRWYNNQQHQNKLNELWHDTNRMQDRTADILAEAETVCRIIMK